MISHSLPSSPPASKLGRFVASLSEALRYHFGWPRAVTPLAPMSRRQLLAAAVDAAKRARRS